jgi:hypothetical protein
MDINADISNWITHLSTKQVLLGGLSICPFAKNSNYEIVFTDGTTIAPPPWDFELIIYVLPGDYTADELYAIASEYNKLLQDMIFLPDHKDRYTEINGIQSNNGKHNLILCQWRDNLNVAREKLVSTPYYGFWDQEYLKEILET